MRIYLLIGMILLSLSSSVSSQEPETVDYKKNDLVWNAGIFKSWLMDQHVGFNKIGNQVTPVFSEQHKMGFGVNANFVHKPMKWIGVGFHLGIGVDVNSVPVPLLLFGGTIALGSKNQFIINAGWADGKRRIISDALRNQLLLLNYTDIPEIYHQTELNTGFYIGLGMKIF